MVASVIVVIALVSATKPVAREHGEAAEAPEEAPKHESESGVCVASETPGSTGCREPTREEEESKYCQPYQNTAAQGCKEGMPEQRKEQEEGERKLAEERAASSGGG
jgi:hypothetical protein